VPRTTWCRHTVSTNAAAASSASKSVCYATNSASINPAAW
jgi:hypothetical protein